jgi:microsomal epoxide hydrolase
VAQGGDLRAFVSLVLAGMDHEHVVGAHVNFLITPPSGDPGELADLGESDQARLRRMSEFIAGAVGPVGCGNSDMASELPVRSLMAR